MVKIYDNNESEDIYNSLLTIFKKELQLGLEGYYVWNMSKKAEEKIRELVNNRSFINEIHETASILQKTIKLKENLKNQLNLNDETIYLSFADWVIKEWGHITTFDVKKNKEKLFSLKQKIFSLDKNIDSSYSESIISDFDAIPSLSKVASFLDADKYPVYDSRVAFALNWLIFINRWHTEDNGKMKFFRQPNGRNGNIKKYSQETIFNFKYKNFDENDDFYYKKNETYDKYCELLNGVCAFCKSSRYEGNIDNISVGLLEMCLFSIAAKNNQKGSIKSNYEEETRFITDDMCKRIHITIDQN